MRLAAAESPARLARDLELVADAETPLAWYLDKVKRGELQAFAVAIGEKWCASVLWKIDMDAGQRCFVIVAAAGDHPEFELTGMVLPRLERLAKFLGCQRVRFHTKRLGLVAKARDHGYGPAEWVMRKELAP